MPRKQIYIRNEDMELFEKAEKLAGDNLSAVIAEAVRRYVDVKEAEAQGMEEHTLTVNIVREARDNDPRKVKFVGRLLASGTKLTGQLSERDDRGQNWKIYQTKAGKIIVYMNEWSKRQGERDASRYAALSELPGYDCPVFEPEYQFFVPGSVIEEAAEALGRELVEYVE